MTDKLTASVKDQAKEIEAFAKESSRKVDFESSVRFVTKQDCKNNVSSRRFHRAYIATTAVAS